MTTTTRHTRRTTLLSLAGAAALITAAVAPTAAAGAATPSYRVVASGLDNPRLLSFSDRGDLFVAEAGEGGAGPCFAGPEGEACFGRTGAITRVTMKGRDAGAQTRVLDGLPSVAAPGTGGSAAGPTDVHVSGSKKVVFTVGLGADPAIRTRIPELAQMGTLRSAQVGRPGSQLIADISAHEARENPMHRDQAPDSNPGGFVRTGGSYLVTDAGGNTLVEASRKGRTETRAVFQDQLATAPPFLGLPPGTKIPAQSVPTSVVTGPDGAQYVSELTGFPFEPGLANIYRVDRDGEVSVYASGLTNVTDLAFGERGVLYAVQLSDAGLLNGPIGSVVAIPAGGGATHTVVADGLFAPYGIAVKGRAAFVTTGSVAADAGQVIAIGLG